jgi:hypothetical protein
MRLTNILIGSAVTVGTFFLGRQALAIISSMRQKPARSFTTQEALNQMREYAKSGIITIISEDSPNRMTIDATNIAGIKHVYLDSSGEHPRSRIDNLDPRFGVYIVHLNMLLKKLGVTKLLDLGITHGGENEQDAHNQGRALDLAGLQGPKVNLNVYRDWGQKPSKGTGVYRLNPSDPGYKIFQSIYNFGTLEGADRSCDSIPRPEGPPSQIGFASCLITPDHPSPSLHSTHQNHMHLQLGRTFGVES